MNIIYINLLYLVIISIGLYLFWNEIKKRQKQIESIFEIDNNLLEDLRNSDKLLLKMTRSEQDYKKKYYKQVWQLEELDKLLETQTRLKEKYYFYYKQAKWLKNSKS